MEEGLVLKDILTNIIFMLLGGAAILLEVIFKVDGTLGWLLVTIGVIFLGIGLVYKSKNPIKMLINFFINFI
ncbi:hypothetical protein HMPREF1982_03112 [Clostridiales bacterium oral taxon 876 str. F0540]|nr:hypothetical protein HMPREF1982_03112 [Clostridiales bacterium oral taxon 876 str. F0540]